MRNFRITRADFLTCALLFVATVVQASYIIALAPIFPSTSTPAAGTSTPGGGTAGSGSVTFTLTPAPSVGSVVVVGLVTTNSSSNDQTQAVTDNQTPPNFYSRLLMFQNDTASTNPRITGFCGVVKTSTGTFTVTGSQVVAGSKFMVAKEYKNGTCNLDNNVAAIGNTHPYSCGSLTTVNPKDIVIALLGYSFGGGGTNTFTAPTGFTLIASQTNGNVVATGSMADKITSATGTFNGTYDGTNVLQPSVNNTSCGQFALLSH